MRVILTISKELLRKNEDIEIVLRDDKMPSSNITEEALIKLEEAGATILQDPGVMHHESFPAEPYNPRKGNGIPAWTDEQDEYLAENYKVLSMDEIVEGMPGYKRTKAAVYTRIGFLKLKKKKTKMTLTKPTAKSMGVSRVVHKGRPPADCDCGRCNERRDKKTTFKEIIKNDRGAIDVVELDKKSESLLNKPRWDEKPPEDIILDQDGNPVKASKKWNEIKADPGDAMQRFRKQRLSR